MAFGISHHTQLLCQVSAKSVDHNFWPLDEKETQPFCLPFGRLNIRFKRGRRPVTDTVDRHIKTRTHKSVFYKGRRLDFFGILRISPVSISLVKTFYMVLLCRTRFAVLILITLEILKTSMLFPCLEPIAIEIASTTAGL